VLVKGSNFLEALNKVDMVVFDKTGTLTKGVFQVSEVIPADGFSNEQVLEAAACAEHFSNHPIAKSIRAYCTDQTNEALLDVKEIPGMGILAHTQSGNTILVGNEKLLRDSNVDFEPFDDFGTIVYVAVNGTYFGAIDISDEIKETSSEAIRNLQDIGIRNIVMLTGDSNVVGEHVAGELDMDEVYSELLPADKVALTEAFLAEKKPKKTLAFVGDGVNDAPVLSRADIGISMGAIGSDAAIEASDIVLMDDDPKKIATAIRISKRTLRIAYQNIVFALGVKGLVLILGALGLVGMWAAVFADVGVSVIAILNAMRVLNVKNYR
jgi:Cd2+/Zn2+-exporting ATPase